MGYKPIPEARLEKNSFPLPITYNPEAEDSANFIYLKNEAVRDNTHLKKVGSLSGKKAEQMLRKEPANSIQKAKAKRRETEGKSLRDFHRAPTNRLAETKGNMGK